jgi:tartrate-resistant acid phosphatase type 5
MSHRSLYLCATLAVFLSSSAFAITGLLLVGDTGKNNEGQHKVSLAMQDLCSREKCDYALLAGDNVYHEVVESENDPILETVFDKYYNPLNIPFLVTLGNHDYGKYSNDWKRGSYQILHSKKNPLFYFPDYYYMKEIDQAVVVVLDTTRLMWKKEITEQAQLMSAGIKRAKATGKWLIVLGHHPYLSNGKHGNAGRYERLAFPYFVSGSAVKSFLDKNVCGKADLYVSGHDHSLQVFDGNIAGCDTPLVVSGSGASGSKLYERNKSEFESNEIGYFHLSIKDRSGLLRGFDHKNNLLFRKIYLKKK